MRELKFRVWSGSEMIYDIMVGKFGVFYVNPGEKKDGLDPHDSACLNPFNTKYYGEPFAMQYTGLKDKNRKEIYEGDILQWEEGWMYKEINGRVEWLSNGFYFRNKQVNWIMPKFCKEAIIIGNICQNPELIKS